MTKTAFPKALYVKRETDDDKEPYYIADPSCTGMVDVGDKATLGIYTLTEMVEVEAVVHTKPLPAKAKRRTTRRADIK